MPNALGIKQHSINEIFVGILTTPVGLARVEVKACLLSKDPQLPDKVLEWPALVLLADEVKAHHEIRMGLLEQPEGSHVPGERRAIHVTLGRVDPLDAQKVRMSRHKAVNIRGLRCLRTLGRAVF